MTASASSPKLPPQQVNSIPASEGLEPAAPCGEKRSGEAVGSKEWMSGEEQGEIQILQGTSSLSRPNPQSRCDLTELAFFRKEPTRVHIRLSPIGIYSS